jgi:dTDP-4-dehydrorhamnose 3,5-epimerase-like enzyme
MLAQSKDHVLFRQTELKSCFADKKPQNYPINCAIKHFALWSLNQLNTFPKQHTESSLVQLINFALKGDDRGSLIALEAHREIPFAIARVYYIFGTRPGVVRGLHAHKTLRQVCVTVCGSLRMVLDNGFERAEVMLNRPDRGLIIEPGVWHEMDNFSSDCVMMVLTDAPYKETDYIRNKEQFLTYVHSSNR